MTKQIIRLSTEDQVKGPNQKFAVDVVYDVSPSPKVNTLTGIGVRLHFNSEQVSFKSIDDGFGDLFGGPTLLTETVNSSDGDDTTNSYVEISYADFKGEWPGVDLTNGLSLGKFIFETTASYDRSGTTINVTVPNTAAGYEGEGGALVIPAILPVLNVNTSNTYRTIGEAIAAAASDDTIQVEAGLYEESFTIDKAITLKGPNQGIKPTSPDLDNPRGAEAWIKGTVTVAANNVTIDGFRLNYEGGPLQWSGRGTLDPSQYPDNFTLVNSYVTGYTGELKDSEGRVISEYKGPVLENANTYNSSTPLAENWRIEDNFIGGVTSGVGGAMQLAGLKDSSISDNIFWRPRAAHLYLASLTNVTIEDNQFKHGIHAGGLDFDGYGEFFPNADAQSYYGRNYWLELKGTNDVVKIVSNTGENNSGGIQLYNSANTQFVFNNVTIENNTFPANNFTNPDPNGNLLVFGNTSQNKSGIIPAVMAFATAESNNLVIKNNNATIDLSNLVSTEARQDHSSIIQVRGEFNGVTIDDNDLMFIGTNDSIPLAAAVSLYGGIDGEVDVVNNRIMGGDAVVRNTAGYYGIDVIPDLNGDEFGGNLDIVGNTIDDFQVGITLRDGNTSPAAWGDIDIFRNTITDNSFAVFNGTNDNDAPDVRATGNYWGSEGGPGEDGANPVGPNVIVDPWYGDAELTNLNSANPVINVTKVTSAASLAAALEVASVGDTLEIGEGNTKEVQAPVVVNTIAGDGIVDTTEATNGFTITGTGIPGATVNLAFDSGGTTLTAPVDANGDWAIAISSDNVASFGEGAEAITASQGDINGNPSLFSKQTFTVQTVPVDPGDSGVAIKGYISRGTVTRVNGTGNSVMTDATGEFTGLTGTGPVKVTGGVDISTGQAFVGELRAPDGAVVLSPLTTLVVALQETGLSADEAITTVRTALGLPANFDFLNQDPIQTNREGGELAKIALQVEKASAQVGALLQGATGTPTGFVAGAKVLAEKMSALQPSTTIDLTDAQVITSFVTQLAEQPGVTLSAAAQDTTNFVTQVVQSNTIIQEATDLGNVANRQAEYINGLSRLFVLSDSFGSNSDQFIRFSSNVGALNLVRPTYADTTQFINFVNEGTENLTITGININIPGVSTDFAGGDIILNPGTTQRFNITYQPTAALQNFNRNDALVILSSLGEIAVGLAGQSTFEADINYDGFVSLADLGPLNANWNPNAPTATLTADINGDGFVALADLGLLNAQWGQSIF